MLPTERFEQFKISEAAKLRLWLQAHHAQEEGVWLVTFKKAVPEKYVSREDVLDELLCFGWIDGIRRKLDEERTMQLITPRRVEHWTKTYKDRAARLIKTGKMQEPGRQSIAAAKRNGAWNFMDDVDALIVPPDLQRALEQEEGALGFFAEINSASKRWHTAVDQTGQNSRNAEQAHRRNSATFRSGRKAERDLNQIFRFRHQFGHVLHHDLAFFFKVLDPIGHHGVAKRTSRCDDLGV